MEDRLRNWAWYVSWGTIIPQPDNTCRSFEKNYVPELGNLYAEQEPQYEPDHVDGDLIEQTIKGLPLQLRQILKARYVSHPYASKNQLAHHLRISPSSLENHIINAKKRIQEELDKRARGKHYTNLLKLQNQKADRQGCV